MAVSAFFGGGISATSLASHRVRIFTSPALTDSSRSVSSASYCVLTPSKKP